MNEERLREAKKALVSMIGNFIGTHQAAVLADQLRSEERYGIADTILAVWERIKTMPQSYQTDGMDPKLVMCNLHYFRAGMDAWITEKDMGMSQQWEPTTPQMQAFGLMRLHGNDSELGYISIRDLVDSGFELDLYAAPSSLAVTRASIK